MIKSVTLAQKSASTDHLVQDLKDRVKEWNGLDVTNFGHNVLSGIFFVRREGITREYYTYLFDKVLLCCCEESWEVPPSPKLVRRKALSPTVGKASLAVKILMSIVSIRNVVALTDHVDGK